MRELRILWVLGLVILATGCNLGPSTTHSEEEDVGGGDVGEAEDAGGEDAGDGEVLLALEVQGEGTVSSSPAGIECPGQCEAKFEKGMGIALEAKAEQGNDFEGWSGACEGSEPICTLAMDGDTSVVAEFGCTPQCEDRECGDDGCGGSCGECPETQQCTEAGTCDCKDGAVDEEGICGIWVLESGAQEWKGYGLDSDNSSNAPDSPIRGAFDIEHDGLAFVLTDDSYHSFETSSRSWTGSWPLSELEPELSSVSIILAYSIPSSHGEDSSTEGVDIMGMDGDDKRIWQMKFDRDGEIFLKNPDGFDGDVHHWDDSNAPDEPSIQAAWMDVHNARGWAEGDPSQICNTSSEEVSVYMGTVSADYVHILESGSCWEWLEPEPIEEFRPFEYPGAPPVEKVGAAFWHQGSFFVFGAE